VSLLVRLTHDKTFHQTLKPYNPTDGFGKKLNATELHKMNRRCFFNFVVAGEWPKEIILDRKGRTLCAKG